MTFSLDFFGFFLDHRKLREPPGPTLGLRTGTGCRMTRSTPDMVGDADPDQSLPPVSLAPMIAHLMSN